MTSWRRWGGEDKRGWDQSLRGTEGRDRAGKKEEQVRICRPRGGWTRFCGTWGSAEASFGPPVPGDRAFGVSVP